MEVLSRDFARAVRALTPAQQPYAWPVEAGGWRTILTPRYRAAILDDRDPRIRAGVEISIAALTTIYTRCRSAEVVLLVVLLPTKESVFWPRVQAIAPPEVAALVADEARLRKELQGALERVGIPYLDALPALQEGTSQPYFEDIDGHLNDVGHDIVERLVASWLRHRSASIERRHPVLPARVRSDVAPGDS